MRPSFVGFAIVAALLCSTLSCKQDTVRLLSGDVRVSPLAVMFDDVIADGRTRTQHLTIVNASRAEVRPTWGNIKAPFFFSPPEVLQPGEVSFGIHLTPTHAGRYSQTLEITFPDQEPVLVSLEASVREVPGCMPSSSCRVATFDVELGRCVEVLAQDDSPCDTENACIQQATCQAGRCVGTAKTCDDGNACTVDVCNATLGCEFLPRPPCPGDGKCMMGVCDPKLGCGFEPASDGTTCGSMQTCNAAEVCISGACVVRDPPDGYRCAEASPCQGEGRCVADKCVRGEVTPLTPTWTYDSSTTGNPDKGILPEQYHDFMLEPDGDMTLAGFFKSAALIRANGPTPVIASQGASRRCILWNSYTICADYPAAPNGKVTAINMTTGETAWSFDIRIARPDFMKITSQLFMARLVVQSTDRLAALFEAYPNTDSSASTQCRRYFVVVLNAQGQLISGQQIQDPLLDQCNHPHPYGVVADSVGNLFIAFSPSVTNAAPLRADKPTLLISFTRDGVFRWKTTDPTMEGGELAVARGLLYPEKGRTAYLASTGQAAFALVETLGRVVIGERHFLPAPIEFATSLRGYEAGRPNVSWTHQLPTGSYFWSDQIRLATWSTSHGPQTIALTFVDGLGGRSLHGINVHDGSEAFTCPMTPFPLRTAPQLLEVANGRLGMMAGALDEFGAPGCSKCDPPFAGSSASFHSFEVPLISTPTAPWIGTFGGPSHDHREEIPAAVLPTPPVPHE